MPGLHDVLPSVAAALGLPVRGVPAIELPPARTAVVVLVDGMGDHQLRRLGGHAPFLRSLRTGLGADGHPVAEEGTVATTLEVGFPSTTATSLGMLGTGRMPGAHGLVGLTVLDPARDVTFNELAWDPAVDPRVWQPGTTVFEDLLAAGAEVVRIGPAHFEGSGLTEAVLRGGRFVAASRLEARVDAALAALAAPGRRLVYLYWGDVDKTGHVHGCDSYQWGEELAATDAALARLAARAGRDSLVVVTADHGMVDVPMHARLDLAHEPDLDAGVRELGGEPRALHLYCRDGAVDDVAAAWRERLGTTMDVVPRADALAAGWFGPVEPWVLPRIGDLLVVARDAVGVVDSRRSRPEFLRLIGQHGARTEAERVVPLLATPGGYGA